MLTALGGIGVSTQEPQHEGDGRRERGARAVIEGKTLAASARLYEVTIDSARYRYQRAMTWLGAELRKAGLGR